MGRCTAVAAAALIGSVLASCADPAQQETYWDCTEPVLPRVDGLTCVDRGSPDATAAACESFEISTVPGGQAWNGSWGRLWLTTTVGWWFFGVETSQDLCRCPTPLAFAGDASPFAAVGTLGLNYSVALNSESGVLLFRLDTNGEAVGSPTAIGAPSATPIRMTRSGDDVVVAYVPGNALDDGTAKVSRISASGLVTASGQIGDAWRVGLASVGPDTWVSTVAGELVRLDRDLVERDRFQVAADALYPELSVRDDGSIHVVWWTNGPEKEVWHVLLSPTGERLAPARFLATGLNPVVMAEPNGAYVAWRSQELASRFCSSPLHVARIDRTGELLWSKPVGSTENAYSYQFSSGIDDVVLSAPAELWTTHDELNYAEIECQRSVSYSLEADETVVVEWGAPMSTSECSFGED